MGMKQILNTFKNFVKKISLPDLILLLGILVLLIVPNTRFDKSSIDSVEKRPLAQFPAFKKDGHINKKFGKEFEDFYNDRFRKRNVCIDINLSVKAFVNRRHENSISMEGKDHWLFYKGDNSIDNFQNKKIFTDAELEKITNNLIRLDKWCKKNDIQLIILIPPDKNRIYGKEFYPKNIKRVNTKSRVQLLKEYVENKTDISFIYPVDGINERKKQDNEPLYYYTDSHWTRTGSYVAYLELVNAVSKKYPQLKPLDINGFETDRKYTREILGKEGDNFVNLKIKGKYPHHTYLVTTQPKKDYKITKNNVKIGILGDSFSGELSNWFKYTNPMSYYWYNETAELFDAFSMKIWEDKILKDKPDVFVIEILERYAYKLLDLYKD